MLHKIFPVVLALLGLTVTLTNGYTEEELGALCSDDSMENGAGYAQHPTDCDKFIQCRYAYTDEDHQHIIRLGSIQQCVFPTFWDMKRLTCGTYNQSSCQKDKCAGRSGFVSLPEATNCRGYWRCLYGKADSFCCPIGFRFEGNNRGCVKNSQCQDFCAGDPILNGCSLLAIPGSPTHFAQYSGRGGYITMPCAPGTAFNQSQCRCSDFATGTNACDPELYLTFDRRVVDMSKNHHYVGEHVDIHFLMSLRNGVATFTGNSRLIVPGFTNVETKTLVIKVKYASAPSSSARAIVSNKCVTGPSIIIYESSSSIYFGVGTSGTQMAYTSVPRLQASGGVESAQEMVTQDVTFTFVNGKLTGSNGVTSTTVEAKGFIRGVHCALHIGDADGYDNFVGDMYEVAVYACIPGNH